MTAILLSAFALALSAGVVGFILGVRAERIRMRPHMRAILAGIENAKAAHRAMRASLAVLFPQQAAEVARDTAREVIARAKARP